MGKQFSFLAVLFVSLLALSGMAFAWGTTGGDGSGYGQLQETAVFFNNSGSTLYAGEVVILDRTGTGVDDDVNLGAYVTEYRYTTGTDTNAIGVVGIVKNNSANQTPVIVVTRGPALADAMDSSDSVTTGAVVGPTSKTGMIGGGDGLGVALEAGGGTDGEEIWIWVRPEWR